MRGSRRRFVLWLLGALPAGWLWRAAEAAPAAGTGAAWVESLADAIVPADGTPGAVGAGVVPRLLEAIGSDGLKARLYERGRAALDAAARAESGKEFAQLPADDRARLFQDLLDAPGTAQVVRAFCFQARADVLALYYTSPEGWRTVGYRPPPYPYPPDGGAGP